MMKKRFNLLPGLIAGAFFLAFATLANAKESHWQIDVNAFQYDMQMYISLMSDGSSIEKWNDVELAAFSATGECRGIAQVIQLGQTNRKIYSLRVRSNSAKEIISFKYYDQTTRQEYDLQQTVAFISDGEYGNAASPFILSRKVELAVDPSTRSIHVAPGGSGNGASADKPAGDLQAAIDKAYEAQADAVFLAPGKYLLPQAIQLRPGIHLKAKDGEPAVLDAQGQSRVMEINVNSRTITRPITLYNLIIKNGYANGDGGGALLSDDVTMESCRFIDNQCTGNGGAMSGGKAVYTVFQNNKATQGGAVANSKVDFCTVVRNVASNMGSGAAYQSDISNSILWNNGGGAQTDGCTFNHVALEAAYNSMAETGLIYLSASNSKHEADGCLAPGFESPETGNWALIGESPLSKLISTNGKLHDLGAINGTGNKRRWLSLAISFNKDFTYGEMVTPLITGKDLWGEVHTDFQTTTYYRKQEETEWKTGLPKDAGIYEIKVNINGNDPLYQDDRVTQKNKANCSILSKKLIVTPRTLSKIYGTADPSITYALSQEITSDITFSGQLKRAEGENVGKYAINLGTLAISTQNYSLELQSADFTITQRPITVQAQAATKIYGEKDPVFTYTLTSTLGNALVGNDTSSGTLARAAGDAVGTYDITIGTLKFTDNYSVSFQKQALSVTQRPITLTAQPATKVYGEADPEFTYKATSTLGQALIGEDKLEGTLARETGEVLGKYALTQGTLKASANYLITFVSSQMAITTRPITVIAQPATKVYGEKDPAFTYTLSSTFEKPLVGEDAFTGTLSREEGENTGEYSINQGSLKLSDNYVIIFTPNKLAVTPRMITVNADASTKIYGEKDPVLTYKATSKWGDGLVGNDTFTGTLARIPGENTGSYEITIGTLKAPVNYAIELTPQTFTITKRPITLQAQAATKVYGEKDPVFTYIVTSDLTTPLVFEDAFSGSLGREKGENVGQYALHMGTLKLSANYAITWEATTMTVTQRPITVTAQASTKSYGCADPVFKYQVTSTLGHGLIGEDQLNGELNRESGENTGNYALQIGTLKSSGNYTIAFVPNHLAITPRPVNVTTSPVTKRYGDSDPEIQPIITSALGNGLVGEDKYTGSLTREKGETIGSYAIQMGTLELGDNYAATFIPSYFTIGKREIIIQADACQKKYGEKDPIFTYQLSAGSALVGNDKIEGKLVRESGENAGSYQILQGSVSLPDNYKLTFMPAAFTIQPLTVTITANAQEKVYGDTDPDLTYSIVPLLIGTDRASGTLKRISGENVGTYVIEQGNLQLSDNYAINFSEGLFTITKRPVIVKANPQSSVYGEPDNEITYTCLPSLIGKDKFNGKLSRREGASVGTYEIQQGSLALSENYQLTFVSSIYTITPRSVIIVALDNEKFYAEVDPELEVKISGKGLVGNDTYAGMPEREAGENVGVYKIGLGTVALSANYKVESFTPAHFKISPATAQIIIDDLRQAYDRNAKQVKVRTIPEGLQHEVTYDGGQEPPYQPGSYEVKVIIREPNYIGKEYAEMYIENPELSSIKCTKVASLSNGSTFEMEYEELVSGLNFQLFDKRGKLIYEDTNYQSGDYNFRGLAVGTYFYVLTYQVENSGNEKRTQKGFVELVR